MIMNIVYTKVSIDLIDETSGFFRKLKRYVGYFRVEQQTVEEVYSGVLTISFSTDKVSIKEGEPRNVYLIAKKNEKGSWYFTGIEK